MTEHKHIILFKNKSIPILILSLIIGTVCYIINLIGFIVITSIDNLSLFLKACNNLILDVPSRNLIDGYKILFNRLLKR